MMSFLSTISDGSTDKPNNMLKSCAKIHFANAVQTLANRLNNPFDKRHTSNTIVEIQHKGIVATSSRVVSALLATTTDKPIQPQGGRWLEPEKLTSKHVCGHESGKRGSAFVIYETFIGANSQMDLRWRTITRTDPCDNISTGGNTERKRWGGVGA